MPCSPAMRLCKTGCLHRQLVMDYVAERDAQEVRAEAVTGGYAAETADYFATKEDRWTFKRWLVAYARRGYDHARSAGLSGPAMAPAFLGGGLDLPPEV